ncbi:MAG: insulinase family protein [Ardenticatenaceae bacterium]
MTYGFELLKEQSLPELNSQARLYRHAETGAELLSLSNDDENKVFGITFRTPPTDSTGLPHIMEHSVLCGSRKYPSKEPFVELLKGSLKTFLNAMTYPDKTVYPVASQNHQDFYNLVDVYLDAVFYPRITPEILQQEGWHYELENVDDPLIFKGVVFNEMKGAYSSPERRLFKATQESLFPDNTYGVDSGGDPVAIPDLTYEQFKSFHDKYYHPSNARIFFYGDDDSTERLRLMAEYLDDFERVEVDSSIGLQTPFSEPKRIIESYPVSEDDTSDKQARVAVSWMLGEYRDAETTLGLKMLNYLLLGTSGSPLRKALIDSGLGEDLVNAGLDHEYSQIIFSTGLKGVSVEDADAIEGLILSTLSRLADEGFEQEAIEAAINSTEFTLRENNTGSSPRGLSWLIESLSTWLYDGDPLAYLAFEEPLQGLKTRLQAGEPIFESLIRDYFLNNTHRTTVILKPDPTLAQKLEEAERARLDAVQATMSEEDLWQVVENTKALKELQETPDSPELLAMIPSLKREDLEPQNKIIPIDVSQHGGSTVLYHDLFTNGIAYVDVGLNLHLLPQNLLPYAALFGKGLLQMGTETEDYVKLSQRIDRQTGGIRIDSLTNVVKNSEQGAAWLFLRGKSMVPQVSNLLDILRDVLLTVRFDNQERFLQLVLENKARLEARLMARGHQIINQRMKAHFNEADWASEQMSGVSQLFFLRELAEQVESDWGSVYATLEQIRQILLNRNAMICNATMDRADWLGTQPQLGTFLDGLPAASVDVASWHPIHNAPYEGLTIPARVNYVGKATDLYKLGYELHGSALVISRYLRTSWIWEKVRVQGGAYGGFSSFDSTAGTFSYLSYRDPNLLDTLNIYDNTSSFLRELDLSQEELTKGIIGAIGDMDSYQLPDAKGYTSMARYIVGKTDEERQKVRNEVLSTTTDDFRAFADTLDLVKENGLVVVMGTQASLEAANEKLDPDKELSITKVL